MKRLLTGLAISVLLTVSGWTQGINPITPPTNWLIQVLDPAFANPSNLYTTTSLLGGNFTTLRATSAGAAATPSLAVGNATTGLYSVSTTGLGVSINGVLKFDYGITNASAWTFGTTLSMNGNPFFGTQVNVGGALINTGITLDTGLTDATVCAATTTGGGGVVGQYYKGTGTAGICLGTSSARYKNNIVDLDVGLPEIMKLRPVEYRLNPDHGDPAKPLYGFLAEDGINVLPKLVGLDDQERPNTMDYLGIVPVLVRAVQQQQAQIDALKRSRP